MDCKNCQKPLRTDYSYCANCGAKIIRNRLTFKNLWYDISERYFNVDNTFLKTFLALFKKPEVVVEGYIQGIRKQYLNPISYLGIALSLSGISLFIIRKTLHKMDLDPFGVGNSEGTMKVMQATLDFSSFVFLLYIPLIALAGWLIYNTKNHNLSEYSVTAIYGLAHFSIASFVINIMIWIFASESYMIFSMVNIFFMALYLLYVVRKVHGKSFINSIAFLLVFVVGFFFVSIFINMIMLLTGIIEFSDLMPKR